MKHWGRLVKLSAFTATWFLGALVLLTRCAERTVTKPVSPSAQSHEGCTETVKQLGLLVVSLRNTPHFADLPDSGEPLLPPQRRLLDIGYTLRHYYAMSAARKTGQAVEATTTIEIGVEGNVTRVAIDPENAVDAQLSSEIKERLRASSFGDQPCAPLRFVFTLRFEP